MSAQPTAEYGAFRKRPVVVQAHRFDGTEDGAQRVIDWINIYVPEDPAVWVEAYGSARALRIQTLEGVMDATEGDWIIRGVAGEFYPCKPDIFEATYEPAPIDDSAATS